MAEVYKSHRWSAHGRSGRYQPPSGQWRGPTTSTSEHPSIPTTPPCLANTPERLAAIAIYGRASGTTTCATSSKPAKRTKPAMADDAAAAVEVVVLSEDVCVALVSEDDLVSSEDDIVVSSAYAGPMVDLCKV